MLLPGRAMTLCPPVTLAYAPNLSSVGMKEVLVILE